MAKLQDAIAQRTWIAPHSLKAKSEGMAEMKSHLAQIRREVIEVAR